MNDHVTPVAQQPNGTPANGTLTFLLGASEQLAAAQSIDEVVDVLRRTARAAVGAEGITVVLREEGRCCYVAEDSDAPLWTGKRFDETNCVSGWAMINQATAVIPDVFADPRVPHAAYAPTFVRSMLMAPIGRPRAIAALGAYWSTVREHDADTIRRLESLARMAAIALENARLLRSAEDNNRQRELMVMAGRIGLWSLDVASGQLDATARCNINFGRDPDEPFTYEDMRECVHEDDREWVYAAIEKSLSTGCDYDVEYRLNTGNGQRRWVGIRAQPLTMVDGRARTLAGLVGDITERKRMEEALQSSAATLEHLVVERTRELVTAHESLRQARKLEAMGQLTGGVAHDFNNLLTPIIGSLDLLQRLKVGSDREQRLIDGALKSADRARTLVQRLLAFARKQPLMPAPVDAAMLIIGMSELVGTTLGSQITLALDLAEDLPPAFADAHQVEMAILNLSVNARDAMPSGGRLRLSARAETVGANHPDDVPPGEYIVIGVADTGTGMDEETRRRAIEPFFSTKGIGQGTGLGLSMAHGLASQLGGALTIESAIGRGTSVRLWLPVSGEAPVRAAVAPVQDSHTGSGTAILVDDEDIVRATTADMLADIGFKVVEASSGIEALRLLRQGGAKDVLITDHMMPQMTGLELARAVKHEWPGLPVLIVSGYSDEIGIDTGIPRLAKPFRQADLASRLSLLLPHGARKVG